jgi:hypothetical protein
MTATTHPVQPIVYGRDASGRPAAIDPSGDSPHVLITGGTGRGLTTMVSVIAAQAARNGTRVSACQPRAEGDLALSATGITAGLGLEETVRLITQAWDEMYDRFTAIERGANPATFRHALLAVDDYQHLAGAPAAVCDPAITALAEIAALGRAARVTALIATHVLYGIPADMLENLSTRIILGPVSRTTALRLFGDTALPDVPAGPGNGIAVTGGGLPAAISVLPDQGGRE